MKAAPDGGIKGDYEVITHLPTETLAIIKVTHQTLPMH